MKIKMLLILAPLALFSCKKGGGTEGCTYESANNYNADAEVDDGSCEFNAVFTGCTDSEASNYNSNALSDDGSCTYSWMQYLGTYDVETAGCGSDHVSTITKGPTGNSIIISNFDNQGEDLRADITGNEFTYSALVDGAGYVGDGYIVDGVITIDYSSCEDYDFPDECDGFSCQLKFTLQ